MEIIDKEILKKLSELKNYGKCKKERTHSHAILLLNGGKDKKEVAEIFEVSERSIYDWVKAWDKDGIASLSRKVGSGRKPILNEEDNKEIIEEEINKYPHQPKKAYATSLEKLSTKMSYKTFKRYLKKHSI